jgi:hypothetical protein
MSTIQTILAINLLGLTTGLSLADEPRSNMSHAVASGRNDVVYLAAATEPYEALPLGNGRQ